MTVGRHDHEPHEQWDELAVGYALAALEPDELDRFVEHLVDQCPQCSQSVADTNAVTADLATALSVPAPRSGMRDAVLGAAFAGRPAVPQNSIVDIAVAPMPTGRGGLHRAGSEGGQDAEDAGDELARRRHGLPARTGWLLAAAAAVVAIAMTVTAFVALNSRDDGKSVADGRQEIIAAITAGGVGRVVPLREDGGAMLAMVVAHPQSIAVIPDGLAANSPSTTYVLWGIGSTAASPVALGVFDVAGSSGSSATVGSDSRGYASFTAFALSHEQGHTPPASPSSILAIGQA